MSVRCFVVVGVVFVRTVGIRVVVSVELVNQLEVLQQRVRRRGQPHGHKQDRYNGTQSLHTCKSAEFAW